MNYQMVPLGVRGDFKIYGVRFNGGNFMFWHKISISVIKEVAVVFEEKYQNMNLSDDMILLSLNGINDYQSWINIINIFIEIMKSDKSKIKFQFVVGSEEQARVVEKLGNQLGILFEINNVNVVVDSVQKENKINVEVVNDSNVEQIFYVDANGNILNSDGNVVGRLGDGVHKINSDDNSLLNENQKIGYIGDYKNMISGGNSLGKGKVLTYKNPNAGTSLMPEEGHVAPPLNRAAFISFPVIIFILSALMLVGSVILLFVLD